MPTATELLRALKAYSPAPTDYFRHGAERVAKTIGSLPEKPARVLDLGSDDHFALGVSLFTQHEVIPQNSPRPITGGQFNSSIPEVVFRGPDERRFPHILFDAERDAFPFPDSHFGGVMCCEVLEHLFFDPAHMLWEANRILLPGGWLMLTTPNLIGWHAIRKAVQGVTPYENSVYFSHDRWPHHMVQHTREYHVWEVVELVTACGFTPERIETHTFGQRERLGLAEWLTLIPAMTLYNLFKCRHPRHLLPRYRRPHTFILARKSGAPKERWPICVYYQ